ncbi:GNAT family N-acetyltransferase [Clostridiisalibacter paucivorans]|uniref:GNAT family N-acetyltransferase n=1 Tax=Clostridiisalibacter paucivorans TaxID=408753 RepID=UPI00047DB58C|nr:GNAT family N-acetyltransferase [Clostridiisalibacter paucivorans]
MKILKSNRLILRPWKFSDLDDLHEFTSNKKVANLAGFNVKNSKDESLNILNQFVIDSSSSLWAIELKNSNKAIGWIELHSPTEGTDKNSKEIGFVLSQKYWGQGLMPEAIKQVISYGFFEGKIDSIVCSHFTNNVQSKRVIEKCGFKYIIKNNDKLYYRLNKSNLSIHQS